MNTTIDDLNKLFICELITDLKRKLMLLIYMRKGLNGNNPSALIVKDSIDGSQILCNIAISRKIIELLEVELEQELKEKKSELFEQMQGEKVAK